MKRAILAAALTIMAAVPAAVPAAAQGMTPDDLGYLRQILGLGAQSPVIAELTANEQQSLHSAIDELKTYPEGRERQVRRYLALVYGRECKRWAQGHPGDPSGETCSPAADPAIEPGKEISDRLCASCHLFGTERAPSYYRMANERGWNAHKVEHALHHSPDMVPLRLTPDMLDKLAAYINSFKGG